MTGTAGGPRIAVIGLGEAGSVIAEDLARDADVLGYDPRRSEPTGDYLLAGSGAAAAKDAELILLLTPGQDAPEAFADLADGAPAGACVVDLTSSAPEQKRDLAAAAGQHRLGYLDAVFMSPVLPTRLATPVLISGPRAYELAGRLNRLRMQVEPISRQVGDAAIRKLLRSIVIKGLSALMIESLQTADDLGQLDWFSEHLVQTLTQLSPATLIRLLDGSPRHSARRLHEMAAAEQMVRQSGREPAMTAATVRVLASLGDTKAIARGPSLR